MIEREDFMKKRRWPTIILLSIFFIGLSVMLYPAISNYWNSKTQSEAIVDYEKLMQSLSLEDYDAYFAEAEAYNEQLAALDAPLADYNKIEGYNDILNLSGNGMMGYVTISKIGVELPLYHGTSESVLNIAVGHLKGTSFPIPGNNTHSVLSAHRGLPTAKLFTDLNRLELGDTFEIKILNRTTIYEVDQIKVINPKDLDDIQIIDDEEHCTLLTCHPYGINTERLLVRGRRIDSSTHRTYYITSDAYKIDTLIVTPIVALPMLFVLLLIVFFKPVKKPPTGVYTK